MGYEPGTHIDLSYVNTAAPIHASKKNEEPSQYDIVFKQTKETLQAVRRIPVVFA